MSVFGDRLAKARIAAGLSQSELARRAGITPQAVQAIEAGRVQTSKSVRQLADIVQRSPEWLMGEDSAGLPKPVGIKNVAVRGLVAAGLWQEDSRQSGDETLVPASPDLRYARLPQVAYRVLGNSMNRLVSDGEYVICVDYLEHPLPLREGDVVVAERRRGGEVERTVKRVRLSRGRTELWPDSDDPNHQKPLKLGINEADVEVRVVGLVVGYYRQA